MSSELRSAQNAPIVWVNPAEFELCQTKPIIMDEHNELLNGMPRDIAALAARTDHCSLALTPVTPPAAQLQGEQPTVVGVRISSDGFGSYIADSAMGIGVPHPGDMREPLMTVAQHERIVATNRNERDRLMDTFVALCDYLGIDPMEAAKLPGKPSEVFIAAIESRAALSAPPAAGVPDGWKLVPSVISPAMVDALRDAITVTSRGTVLNAAHAIYAAIEAAPTPPASEQQQAVVLPERREHPSMSMYAGFKEYATAYGEVSGHNDCLDQIERLNPHLAGVNQGVTVAGNGGDA